MFGRVRKLNTRDIAIALPRLRQFYHAINPTSTQYSWEDGALLLGEEALAWYCDR